MGRIATHILGVLITLAVWGWLASADLPGLPYILIAVFGTLAVIPIVIAGRWMLDREPTIERAEEVTTCVHYLIAVFFGSAVLAAVRLAFSAGQAVPVLELPVSPWVGLALVFASSLLLILVILNLALKGLGAPFAVALTQLVATEWFYAWTRNPMVLAALLFLAGIGLWRQSGLFLLWLLIFVIPAVMVFVRIYEERELEIRFGQAYLAYKARTATLIPRRPQ